MGDKWLEISSAGRNLGAGVSSSAWASRAPGQVCPVGCSEHSTLKSNHFPTILLLEQPHLEYCVLFWAPQYKRNVKVIERIQRRSTKLVTRAENKSHEECLRTFRLSYLEKRRSWGNLTALCSSLRRRSREKCWALLLETDDRMGMAQSCTMAGLHWTWRKMASWRADFLAIPTPVSV